MTVHSTPCALGARVVATREATRDVFGDDGVDAVLAALSPETRDLFLPGAPPAPWVAEAAYMAWMSALWDGPCARDEAALRVWVDRLTDRGFGAARRMLLALASPWVVLRRAGALWHGEHTHGELSVTPADGGARFELRDHPFVDDHVASLAVSEAYRHIVFRCRVRWARERHYVTEGALVVVVHWG